MGQLRVVDGTVVTFRKTARMAKGKTAGKKSKAAEKNDAQVARPAQQEAEEEERPMVVRFATVAAVSYIAHKIWTKRKLVTEAWYSEAQSETEQSMVSAFEFFGSMGLIFVVGIAVGVAFSKLSAFVKRR